MIAKRIEVDGTIYFQTLNGHIEDCLKILKSYFLKKDKVLKSFCQKWEIDDTNFKKNLFLAVAFHDIAKLTKEFQNNINAGKSSQEYPHPFFALPILDELPFDNLDNLPIPIFAIAGHHTQLHRTIYEYVSKKVEYLKNEIIVFADTTILGFYNELDFEPDFILPKISLKNWQLMNPEQIRQNFIFKYSRQGELGNFKTKSIFTYFFSILQLCDDYSSANFKKFIEREKPKKTIYDSVLDDTEEYIYELEYSKDEFQKMIFKNHTPYSFQKDLARNRRIFSFLFAPCGRGKTEAALWWAFQVKNLYKCDRVILALPTQVTCNAMYDRLLEEYNLGDKNVGLFHGKSFIALKYRQKDKEKIFYEEEINETDEKKYDLLKDDTFRGSIFFKPITVTTIDHLAYSFVHGFSQADFAIGNLQNSVIIFDEVHYYETHTLNVLLRVFSILREMKIPHLLMTGTAPEFLLNGLNRKKDVYSIYKDHEGLKFKPFTIVKREKNIFDDKDIFKEIKKDYINSKKIFVVLNQVEWTQNFYIDLKRYLENNGIAPKMILYHSRFIYKDRVKKEKEIKELIKSSPCIVIATQVIEISLNISSDVMYSQIAPPDAIGQRGGRLHRSGEIYKSTSYPYEMKLFNLENYNPYPENIVKDSWGNFQNGPISYHSIKDICDQVYKGVNLRRDSCFYDYFKANILFGNKPNEVATADEKGKALKIREEVYQTIDIIPQIFEQELFQKDSLIVEYKCSIPYYYISKNPYFFRFEKEKFQQRVIFCNYPYSYEIGLQSIDFKNIDERIM